MRIFFVLIIALFFTTTLKSQNQYINIPDVNFLRALIKAGVDKNNDGKIDTTEANKVTSIYIYRNKIKKLKGIEYFKNIDSLFCGFNNLKNLDISKNIKLNNIDISYNTNLKKVCVSELPFSKKNITKYNDKGCSKDLKYEICK